MSSSPTSPAGESRGQAAIVPSTGAQPARSAVTASKPTVAVVGASAERAKFGNKSVRAHAQAGYQVYPINPRAAEIEGRPAFANLADLPVSRLDRITVYLPPAAGLSLVDALVSVKCDELWLNPGSESPELVAALVARGVQPILGCSIVALGVSPRDFP